MNASYGFCPHCHKLKAVYENFTGAFFVSPATTTIPVNFPTTNANLYANNAVSMSAVPYTYTPLPTEFCTCSPQDVIDEHKKELDAVYSERNKCVALLVRMALALGITAGIGKHVPKEGEEWEEDWLHIAFIDLPSGQVSWHIHDSEMAWFAGVPDYTKEYDGHDTEEKYQRVLDPKIHERKNKV